MSINIKKCDEVMKQINEQFEIKVVDDVDRYRICYLIEIIKKIIYKNVEEEYMKREGPFLLRYNISILDSYLSLSYKYVYFAICWLFHNIEKIKISLFFETSSQFNYFLIFLQKNIGMSFIQKDAYSADFPTCRYICLTHRQIGSKLNIFKHLCICTLPEQQDLVYINFGAYPLSLKMLGHYSETSVHVLCWRFAFLQLKFKNININEI
jgi:hypothetical protein